MKPLNHNYPTVWISPPLSYWQKCCMCLRLPTNTASQNYHQHKYSVDTTIQAVGNVFQDWKCTQHAITVIVRSFLVWFTFLLIQEISSPAFTASHRKVTWTPTLSVLKVGSYWATWCLSMCMFNTLLRDICKMHTIRFDIIHIVKEGIFHMAISKPWVQVNGQLQSLHNFQHYAWVKLLLLLENSLNFNFWGPLTNWKFEPSPRAHTHYDPITQTR